MRRRSPNPRIERQAEVHNRALHSLSHMRREHLSLAAACRLEHIKPATFLRHVGSAVRQDKPGGRFYTTKGDRFKRSLQIPTALGPTAIPVYGIKDARKVSEYLNAIGAYLRTGDETKLRRFKGKTLKIRGQKIDLITDPATLTARAEEDALHLDQLYASATGRA